MRNSNLKESFNSPQVDLKLFDARTLAIASMHGKHHVMEPVIKKYLKLDSTIVPNIDTDQFGTFSGEVERASDPITTLRNKIIAGLKASGQTLGIGNEGSFGPHPQIPFIAADNEIAMFIDLENNIEITESVLSLETNHAKAEINTINDLNSFAEQIGFPSHGLILKQEQDGQVVNIRKGIVTWDYLHAVFYEFISPITKIIAETDMRGHMNPTRMKVIESVTEMLMKKVTSLCPECRWPGFSVAEVKHGLPCSHCGEETKLTLSQVYECKNCSHTDEQFYTHGQKADPQYCDHCNP